MRWGAWVSSPRGRAGAPCVTAESLTMIMGLKEPKKSLTKQKNQQFYNCRSTKSHSLGFTKYEVKPEALGLLAGIVGELL